MKLKFEKMPMSGIVKLPEYANIFGCVMKDGSVMLAYMMEDWMKDKIKERHFATITAGAEIIGVHEYICPVPGTDLFLFELKGAGDSRARVQL